MNYLLIVKVLAVAGLVYGVYSAGYSARDNEIAHEQVKSLSILIEQDRKAVKQYTVDVATTIETMRKHAESQLADIQKLQTVIQHDLSEVNRIETEAKTLPVTCVLSDRDVRLYNQATSIIRPPEY